MLDIVYKIFLTHVGGHAHRLFSTPMGLTFNIAPNLFICCFYILMYFVYSYLWAFRISLLLIKFTSFYYYYYYYYYYMIIYLVRQKYLYIF